MFLKLPTTASLISFQPFRFSPAKALMLTLGMACAALPAASQKTSPRYAPPRAATESSIVIPESSKPVAGDAGKRMHSNVRFMSNIKVSPAEAPPFAGYLIETPASLACIYRTVKPIPGCNPNVTTNTPSGGSQTIAIVDAFDDPNAAADLAFFSAQFGLPYSDSKFKVVYAGGSAPPADPSGGWELEESLDIEYSHAMAPNATIYLVEAASNSFTDLFTAVLEAGNLISCGKTTTCPAGSNGKGEVSMSFSGGEFEQEAQLDFVFSTPGVVYFAASGDESGTGYPCVSPNVVCVGGTSNARSLETGNLISQVGWADAGGGISYYEPTPSYQSAHPFIANQLYGGRGVPDISAIANPSNGVWIWDTFPYEGQELGWLPVGGTSVATPVTAGIVNASSKFATSSAAELTLLYASHGTWGNNNGIFDVTYGSCNIYAASFAGGGWDFCSGLGSPLNLASILK